MTDLFCQDSGPIRACLADYVAAGDKAGALRRLQSLRGLSLDQEVLSAGLTMISRSHGKQAVIVHVLNQF